MGRPMDLIADLDRATPQVEIEARIVVTSRAFTRELGIQWGFQPAAPPQFGNTTGLTFPNSIILNGHGVLDNLSSRRTSRRLSNAAGIGTAGPRLRGQPARGQRFNTALGISMGNILGSFSLDAALTALETPGPRTASSRRRRITTQNNQAGGDQAGHPDPHPDRRPTTRSRCSSRTPS